MFINDCIISFVAVTCVKFLFVPSYKSTDFEVHRNWMAITYQKPLEEWYTESTSEWTLDYPPLFAWFELLLSKLAQFFDPKMLIIENLNYQSSQTIFFMRLSVILSDIIYCYSVNRFFYLIKNLKGFKNHNDPWNSPEVITTMLLLWNPGLLLVDHIHFQYNGFLSGFLLLSICDIFEGHYVCASFWFSVLINLKHIYLYFAPAYFLFLFKNYCFQNSVFTRKESTSAFSVLNFVKLASTGIFVVILAFGPYIYMGQLKQVISRLFPIKRGLTHTYWAPNVWAVYNFADWILSHFAPYLNIAISNESCTTQGLVGDCAPAVLPHISALTTSLLASVALLPVLWVQFQKVDKCRAFLDSIILCSFASFLFGYHVHEKAILLILLPLTIAAVLHAELSSLFVFSSIIGHFSLFPLLHTEGETPLKILLLLLHVVYLFSSLSQLHRPKPLQLHVLEILYLGGLLILQFIYSFSGIERKLPFLPLMLISTYCAVGIIYSWLKYCYITFESYKTKASSAFKKRR